MNPDTNKFEQLSAKSLVEEMLGQKVNELEKVTQLLRPNGEPVPKHWSIFTIDEEIVIKDYTFKVAYINESSIIFEPVGIKVIDNET